MEMTSQLPIDWDDIASQLSGLTAISGGFSQTQRGLLELANGQTIFVKIATEERTARWTQREVATYLFLEENNFQSIPKLLSYNPEQTAFALEALTPNDGWDWEPNWSEARLEATLAAMDDLAKIVPESAEKHFLSERTFDERNEGWGLFAESPELQKLLRDKMRAQGYDEQSTAINIDDMAARSGQFTFRSDTLVHNDVRADNCAWNAETGEVKFVDWNWVHVGDKRVDDCAFLVHVHQSGFDVLQRHTDRLDVEALYWLAGFWCRAAVSPMWVGGPEQLRDLQLESAMVAFDLARTLESKQ